MEYACPKVSNHTLKQTNWQPCHAISDVQVCAKLFCKNKSVSQLVVIKICTFVDCKQPRCSDTVCLQLIWYYDLTACLQWSNSPRCLVLSTSRSLWFSLWTVYFGIWWLLRTCCPGEWKPTEPNRHVAKLRCWPLKWRFPWDSTRVMSDIRSYCCSGLQASGDKTVQFSIAKKGWGWGWGVPSETYSRHHIVCLVREWCNRAERGSWKLHMHIRACLHSLGCDSRSTNPTKIKLQCDVWGAQLCFFWLRQFLTTRVWNPILCCPLLNWLPLSFQHSPLTVTKERPLPVKHWPEWWLTVKCVTVFQARLQSRQT